MGKLTRAQFAARIKSKYPEYAQVPDEDLVTRMLSKYPEYQDSVEPSAPQTTTAPPQPVGNAGEIAKKRLAAMGTTAGKVKSDAANVVPAAPATKRFIEGVKSVSQFSPENLAGMGKFITEPLTHAIAEGSRGHVLESAKGFLSTMFPGPRFLRTMAESGGEASGDQLDKAIGSSRSGHPLDAVAHGVASAAALAGGVIPHPYLALAGQLAPTVADDIEKNNYAGLAGDAVGVATNIVGEKIIAKGGRAALKYAGETLTPPKPNSNRTGMQAAVERTTTGREKFKPLREEHLANQKAEYDANLSAEVDRYNQELRSAQQDYSRRLGESQADYDRRLKAHRGEYDRRLQAARQDYDDAVKARQYYYDNRLKLAQESYDQTLAATREALTKKASDISMRAQAAIDPTRTNQFTADLVADHVAAVEDQAKTIYTDLEKEIPKLEHTPTGKVSMKKGTFAPERSNLLKAAAELQAETTNNSFGSSVKGEIQKLIEKLVPEERPVLDEEGNAVGMETIVPPTEIDFRTLWNDKKILGNLVGAFEKSGDVRYGAAAKLFGAVSEDIDRAIAKGVAEGRLDPEVGNRFRAANQMWADAHNPIVKKLKEGKFTSYQDFAAINNVKDFEAVKRVLPNSVFRNLRRGSLSEMLIKAIKPEGLEIAPDQPKIRYDRFEAAGVLQQIEQWRKDGVLKYRIAPSEQRLLQILADESLKMNIPSELRGGRPKVIPGEPRPTDIPGVMKPTAATFDGGRPTRLPNGESRPTMVDGAPRPTKIGNGRPTQLIDPQTGEPIARPTKPYHPESSLGSDALSSGVQVAEHTVRFLSGVKGLGLKVALKAFGVTQVPRALAYLTLETSTGPTLVKLASALSSGNATKAAFYSTAIAQKIQNDKKLQQELQQFSQQVAPKQSPQLPPPPTQQ